MLFSLVQKGGGKEISLKLTNWLGTSTNSIAYPILFIFGK